MSSSVTNIAAELHRVRQDLAEQHATRACLFTLIIWSGERKQYFEEVAQRLLQSFPCRLMFLSPSEEASDDLVVGVSAVVSGSGEHTVSCDRIDVAVGEGARRRVPSLLLPHLVPDLPIYLMWGEDPCTHNAFFESLRPLATKLIFDSEHSGGMQRYAQKLLQIHHADQQQVGDLNWVRTDPWRELLARTFNSPQELKILVGAESVRIRYNACTGNFCHFTAAQAIYLQSWIASSLQWGPGTYNTIEQHQRLSCKSVEGPVVHLLLPEERKVIPEGQVSGLEIHSRQGESILFQRRDLPGFAVDVYIEHADYCEMPIHVMKSEWQRGHSLAQEVVSPGTSQHLIETLHWLSRTEMDG